MELLQCTGGKYYDFRRPPPRRYLCLGCPSWWSLVPGSFGAVFLIPKHLVFEVFGGPPKNIAKKTPKLRRYDWKPPKG